MSNITYAIYPTTKIIGLISYDFYSTHINSLQFLPVSSWNLAKLFNKYSGNGSFGKRWQATENFATNSPVTKLIHFHPVSNVIPIVANMCQQLSIAKGPNVWVRLFLRSSFVQSSRRTVLGWVTSSSDWSSPTWKLLVPSLPIVRSIF